MPPFPMQFEVFPSEVLNNPKFKTGMEQIEEGQKLVGEALSEYQKDALIKRIIAYFEAYKNPETNFYEGLSVSPMFPNYPTRMPFALTPWDVAQIVQALKNELNVEE